MFKVNCLPRQDEVKFSISAQTLWTEGPVPLLHCSILFGNFDLLLMVRQ